MKKYEVIGFFTDLRDYDHPYNVGDEFPRQGVTVSEERLAELSSDKNRQGRPLIRAVEDSDNSIKEDAPPVQTANPETKDDPAVTPTTQENDKPAVNPDIPAAESHKYSKSDIEAMKLNQIREVAGKLGFKISSTSKDGAVAEFMEKQG